MIIFPKLTLRRLFPASKTFLLAMKLSIILCFVGMIQVSASVYSQNSKMSFSYKDITVRDVLDDIEKSTNYRFFYNEDFIDMNRKVTMEGTDLKVEELLAELLEPSDANFKILENNLIVIAPSEMMQQRAITGTINDAKTGVPLPGLTL